MRAGRLHMETGGDRGSIPPPRGVCASSARAWVARREHSERRDGWGEPQRKPCLWQPPPRPPLPDDATHRRRSADPPRKGEGSRCLSFKIANRSKMRASILLYAIALPRVGRDK